MSENNDLKREREREENVEKDLERKQSIKQGRIEEDEPAVLYLAS